MESYIAVDNVCAWPNIKKLPGGEIIAVIFNQPCHLHWEGTIDCWINKEGDGRFWEFLSNPIINEPGTNRGNVAVGLNNSGEVIVLCSGWSNVLPKPEKNIQGAINDDTVKESFAGRAPLWPVCCISKDNAKTWEKQETKLNNIMEYSLWIPYGDIITLDNGNLGCSMYGADKRAYDGELVVHKLGSFFFESEDNGLTWDCLSCIYEKGNETTVVKLPNGKILAAVRSTQLDLFESEDGGKNWKHCDALTGKREYPAAFTMLKEGYLLLTHGIRLNGLYGLGAKLMTLDDETWRHIPMILADFGDTNDGGYPSSVQLDDGTIITAYYAKSEPSHSRYHMGIKIWTLAEKDIEPAK